MKSVECIQVGELLHTSIGKPKTFACLVGQQREAKWLERPPECSGSSNQASIGSYGSPGSKKRKVETERNITPMRVKVKRLEAMGRAGVSTTGREKDFQSKILSFLSSKGGGEDTYKALASYEVR